MKYFKENKDWEYNSRILSDDNIWLYYGEGYKLTIDLIEKQILETDRTNQDFFIYPYCYIIRHYIEIRLKEVVFEGNKIIGKELPLKLNHDLSKLWKESQEVLENVWKESFEKAPDNISQFITEFHSIDVKSDSFRYPIDKEGKINLGKIKGINFKQLSEIVNEVKYYLDGITDGLAVLKDESKNNSKIETEENTAGNSGLKQLGLLGKILSWFCICKVCL